jgi:2-dehydro-3-deoxyphosphogluconate aldolase/(4S)-4-hydroxy-2-oxoglutarate aldolase
MPNPLHLLDQLVAHGVVPVVRTSTAALARVSVEWLREAGFRTFEITMTIPGAAELIAELAKDESLLIGAGTVFTATEAERVVAAGARYVVSPCVIAEVGAACRRLSVPSLMGTLTPTEVHQALLAGSAAVKLFPASSVGPGHLKALRSVFPKVMFMPTGGVDASGVAEWIKAGAACVGVGGKLVDEALIKAGDKSAVLDAAAKLLANYRAAKSSI